MELEPHFTLVFLDEADTKLGVLVTEVEEGQLVLTAPSADAQDRVLMQAPHVRTR
jgi:hypothetical protein